MMDRKGSGARKIEQTIGLRDRLRSPTSLKHPQKLKTSVLNLNPLGTSTMLRWIQDNPADLLRTSADDLIRKADNHLDRHRAL